MPVLGSSLPTIARLVAGEPDIALVVGAGVMKLEQLLRQFVLGDDDASVLAARTREDAIGGVVLPVRAAHAGEELDHHGVFGIRRVHGPGAHGDGGAGEVHHAIDDQAPAVLVVVVAENLLPGMAAGAILLQGGFFFGGAGHVPENFGAAQLRFEAREWRACCRCRRRWERGRERCHRAWWRR